MADVTPNFELEVMQLEVEMSQLEHNKRAQRLRVMQNEDENRRLAENMTATDKAIEAIREQIKNITSSSAGDKS